MLAMKRLRKKTHLLVVLMVFFSSVGDILLSKGMKQVGSVSVASPASLVRAFFHTITNGTIWLGIGSFLMFFVCYMLVLSWADYSYVMPASAIGYAIVPLLGYALLGEVVSSTRWAGVGFICLGVMLVGRTPPRTTEPQ
jgi:drug/metabolite transporter (DMT)-like permease